MSARLDDLLTRLHKGIRKTTEIMSRLDDAQWQAALYAGPPTWTVRDMLAHLLSAEEMLLRIAQDVAAGGRGAPEGLDYDAVNASEQIRLAGRPPAQLLADLVAARQATLAWVQGLDETTLDRLGYHPALGEVALETILNAIYGHQLMHMRDLQALLRP